MYDSRVFRFLQIISEINLKLSTLFSLIWKKSYMIFIQNYVVIYRSYNYRESFRIFREGDTRDKFYQLKLIR